MGKPETALGLLGMIIGGEIGHGLYNFNPITEQTPFQEQIERNVTSGLGFDSRSDFECIITNYGLREDPKDSIESLKAHLAEMDYKVNPSFALGRIVEQYKKLARDIETFPNNHDFYHGPGGAAA
jgi:hypothetical protein